MFSWNSRADFGGKRKNEQTVKSARRPKKSYTNAWKCAKMIYVKLCDFAWRKGEEGCL
jgi:hypothetical protein